MRTPLGAKSQPALVSRSVMIVDMSQPSPTHGPFGSFGFEPLSYGGEHIALLAKQRIK